MNIAVNTRLLLKNKLDGIGWFTYESLKRITKNHPEHKFYFIFDRQYSNEFIFSDNIEPIIASPQARHPILWYLYFEFGVNNALKKSKADIFLSPDGWLSLKSNVPSVDVIHDLNFNHFPEFIPWHVRQYYYSFFPKYAKKAKRIATVSEFTKNDISKKYGINKENIDVVYNGANTNYLPINEITKKQIQKKYTNGNPYFLFIGTIHPRKNLKNLLLAFDKFKKSNNSNLKLFVVGSKKWWPSDLEKAYNSMLYKDEVIFFGRASENQLKEIIPAAFALTYPSFFEGFGIPILEAFNCKVPVITSNSSSMPEIGGDAAIYVNPSSIDSIHVSLNSIFNDSNLRNALIIKGFERKNLFSWDKTANNLWTCIEKIF